jgi:UDP-N-acetylglucosamine 1-carboxyvinyltransferase
MDRIQIRGGAKLQGSIPISGAKNAALPLMIASLLTDQMLTLENLPRLADVSQLVRILGNHGVDYSDDRRFHRALRARVAHARQLLGHRAAHRARRRSARLAARRLRDRHPPR